MNHDHPEELLSAYLGGELSSREKATVEEHLTNCEQCMDQLEEMQALDRLLGSREDLTPSNDFALRVMHAVHEDRQKRVERKFTISGWIGVAVVILVVLVFLTHQQERLAPPPDIVQQQRRPAPAQSTPEEAHKPPVEQKISPVDAELIAHLDQLENMELIRQYETMEYLEMAVLFNEEELP